MVSGAGSDPAPRRYSSLTRKTLLGALQLADVVDQVPDVLAGDQVRERRHVRRQAIGHDGIEVAIRHTDEAILSQVGRWPGHAILLEIGCHYAVAVASLTVADGAVDVEDRLPARDRRFVRLHRILELRHLLVGVRRGPSVNRHGALW